jgi:type VI secretion system protein ImpK
MSTHATPLGSYRGSSPAMDRRGWTLALEFQEIFTAIVRLRYNRQAVANADAFRAQMKQALREVDQSARGRGYSAEDVKEAVFAVVAFLDESVLGCHNPAFANWARLPMQAELYGQQLAGEIFFQKLQMVVNRADSQHTADLLEIYYLCLLLGFKGRYAAGGDIYSLRGAIQEKIRRVRGSLPTLSPRGALPADAVRLGQADKWVGRLAIGTMIALVLAAGVFLVCKFMLIDGVSKLSTLAAQSVR